MKSTAAATTVADYLAGLPPERREIITAVREVVLTHLPAGYEEVMQYGMIAYVVPHRLYPSGYHCDPRQPLTYAGLGVQKNHCALYLMGAYGDAATRAWLEEAWAAAGKKLDMGKACLRFKKLDDLSLPVLGHLIARIPVATYIARVQAVLATTPEQRRAAREEKAQSAPSAKAKAKAKAPAKSEPKTPAKAKSKRTAK